MSQNGHKDGQDGHKNGQDKSQKPSFLLVNNVSENAPNPKNRPQVLSESGINGGYAKSPILSYVFLKAFLSN